MEGRDRVPVRAETTDLEVRGEGDYWEKYGWQTTVSLSVGIGAAGSLQFLVGVTVAALHPVVSLAAQLVLLLGAPILVVAGIVGFLLPVQSLVRHHFMDRDS